jgi:hypothetical protein
MSKVDLIYSSPNICKLTSIADAVTKYTLLNKSTEDRKRYTYQLVKSVRDVHRLVPSNIGKLTRGGAGQTCLLCETRLHTKNKARMLKCGHMFHSPCIEHWLIHKRFSCPCCKTNDLLSSIKNI